MKTIKKTIKIDAYKDNQGNPCCARDFSTGEVCQFYRTVKFGCTDTCVFAEDGDHLWRRKGGDGTLIPIKNCPVWKTK